MTTSMIKNIRIEGERLTFDLGDGREVSLPVSEAAGPILASGLYEDGYDRIPWLGATEPAVSVPALCVICRRHVENGITIAVDRQTVVGACSNAHYVQWWNTHQGEVLHWGESHPDSPR